MLRRVRSLSKQYRRRVRLLFTSHCTVSNSELRGLNREAEIRLGIHWTMYVCSRVTSLSVFRSAEALPLHYSSAPLMQGVVLCGVHIPPTKLKVLLYNYSLSP